MLYILPVIILVLFFFSNNKTLAIEFVLGVFLSECCCISFFFSFLLNMQFNNDFRLAL